MEKEIVKNHKKTLICISDIKEKGKTETAENVKNKLISMGASVIYNDRNISFVLKIKKQQIGVDTRGDPNTGFPTRIDYLGRYPCDAIVCTSRSSGTTLKAAEATAKKYSLLFIKTTTYQPDDDFFNNIMNDYRADDLIELLKKRRHL